MNADDRDRLDRELRELLEGLRVLLPGVQVLFAFLLTSVFSAKFDTTTSDQRVVYFVALSATAISTVLIMVPSVWHRLWSRPRDKELILQVSNRYVIVGTGFLALAILSSLYLVTDFLYGTVAAATASGALAVVLGGSWYLVPWLHRRSDREHRKGAN